MSDPAWLPPIIRFEDFSRNWDKYVEAVYGVFHQDFIQSQPLFHGRIVRCRRDPLDQGKEAGFWHCISSGSEEDARLPEFRRMECIPWLRPIIEHATDSAILVWGKGPPSDRRFCVWFREEHLIVLGQRNRYWQLITAYDTPQEHRQRKLRREYEENRR